MNTKISKETENNLYNYLDACNNLYGLITLRKILSIYNQQNEPISEEAFLDFIENIDFDEKFYEIFGIDEIFEDHSPVSPMERELVSEYLYSIDDNDYIDMREAQMGIPYYVPKKEQLLKYADQFYFEKTPEFISLRAFLRNLGTISKEVADSIADDIILTAQMENNDIDAMLETAKVRGVVLNNNGLKEEFVQLCFELDKNTRKHIFCGHTSKELLE